MQRYSIITAHGSVENYLSKTSDLGKLLTTWGNQGYQVVNVVVYASGGKDTVLATLQKAEPA
jgi:hypothetical protein